MKNNGTINMADSDPFCHKSPCSIKQPKQRQFNKKVRLSRSPTPNLSKHMLHQTGYEIHWIYRRVTNLLDADIS